MEDYLPYLDVYDEALAPPVEDFGGGFALPEAVPPQRAATDLELELIDLVARQHGTNAAMRTVMNQRVNKQRQEVNESDVPEGVSRKNIIKTSVGLGLIDPLTGKFTRIEDTPLYYPNLNTFRSPQEQRALRDWFPDLDWGYRRGELVPFSSI